MSKKPKGINPEKMTRLVRHLWQLGEVAGLTVRELAGFVGAPASSVYYWFAGMKPRKGHQKLILAAIPKIQAAYPEPALEQLPSGALVSAASWGAVDPDDPEVIEGKAFDVRMLCFFNVLQARLPEGQRRLLAVSWMGFTEVVHLAEKYGVEIPKK